MLIVFCRIFNQPTLVLTSTEMVNMGVKSKSTNESIQ